MANCNDLFQKLLSKISLTAEQRNNLKRGRDTIKERIENHFSEEKEVAKPEFCLQGSYALKTMVQPLGQEDYDLDDGIYLQHTDDNISKPTPATVSGWIVEAVKKHTKKAPENKKNCVRVVYAENYHIDLPIYRTIKGKIYLGTLDGNEWVLSDAKAFNKWFYDRLEKTEQMRSCIKYLKAWKDFEGCDLKGIHITTLVSINHVAVGGRDDESLVETIAKAVEHLQNERSIHNPVDDKENLIADWSDRKLDKVIESLEKLLERAEKALNEEDKVKSSELWQKIFDKRFPIYEGKSQSAKKRVTILPAEPVAARPKPYGV